MNSKRNRAAGMMQLRDHLKELFALVGIKPQKVVVAAPPKVLELLELVIKDEALQNYLEALDADSIRAIEKMKDRNLSDWNNRENEQLLDRLEEEKETLLEANHALSAQNETLLRKCDNYESRQQEMRNSFEEMKACVDSVRKEQVGMIREMIFLRDSLLIRAGWIAENAPEETAAAKLVDTQLKETARIMANMGVEIMEDTGKFDSKIHTVMETCSAPSPDLIDHIAQTVRPGYRFKGEILRSQEVVLYGKCLEGA